MARSPESEIAKVSLSLAGPRVEVPVQRSWFRWLKRILPEPLQDCVRAVAARVHMSATEDDKGQVDVWLHVVNFSRRRVVIQDVALDWFNVEAGGIDDPQVSFKGPGTSVDARSAVRLHFRIRLHASDIRTLRRLIEPAHHPFQSPRSRIEFCAWIKVASGRKQADIRCVLDGITPWLNLSNPSSRTEASD